MRRFPMKALFVAFSLTRGEKKRVNWDRNILIFSTVVTIGLVVLYFFGKATERW